MSIAIVGLVIIVSPLVFLVVGLLSGQRWSFVFPLLMVPAIYVGMDRGWWGNGVGDAWQIPMVVFTLVGMLTASAGVRIRQVLVLQRGWSSDRYRTRLTERLKTSLPKKGDSDSKEAETE